RAYHVQRAELRKLTSAPLVEIPLLRIRLRAINRVPARRQVEHRRLHPLDRAEPGSKRSGEPTSGRKPEEVRKVVLGCRRASSESRDGFRWLALGDEHVCERRVNPSEKTGDAYAEAASDTERNRPYEAFPATCNVHRELGAMAFVTPPRQEPAMEEKRRWTRHCLHEIVPTGGAKRSEAFGRVEGLQGQIAAIFQRVHDTPPHPRGAGAHATLRAR